VACQAVRPLCWCAIVATGRGQRRTRAAWCPALPAAVRLMAAGPALAARVLGMPRLPARQPPHGRPVGRRGLQ
jgi:hypothetical protein